MTEPSGTSRTVRRGTPDQRLTRNQRLIRPDHFREAYEQGDRWAGTYMILWLRRGKGADLRLGVVASRRVGGAVARAKARRKLREAYRQNRHGFHGDVDVVLVARRNILRVDHRTVTSELLALAERSGLLRKGT